MVFCLAYRLLLIAYCLSLSLIALEMHERLRDFPRFDVAVMCIDGVTQSKAFAFLDAGKTQLMLNAADDLAEDETLTELVFEVDDIAAAYSEMASRGVVFEVEPRAVMESEGRELQATHFHDPDGHLASITGWVESS